MSVPVLGPFCVLTFPLAPCAVVDGRVRCVYYFLSMESKRYEDIDVLVEGYREKLGLMPWEDWAAIIDSTLRREHGIDNRSRRRTGRTQFGILRAIAMCEQKGAVVLSIQAEPLTNMNYCIGMARTSIDRLELDIRVTADFPGCSDGNLAVLYTDHHIPTRAR